MAHAHERLVTQIQPVRANIQQVVSWWQPFHSNPIPSGSTKQRTAATHHGYLPTAGSRLSKLLSPPTVNSLRRCQIPTRSDSRIREQARCGIPFQKSKFASFGDSSSPLPANSSHLKLRDASFAGILWPSHNITRQAHHAETRWPSHLIFGF